MVLLVITGVAVYGLIRIGQLRKTLEQTAQDKSKLSEALSFFPMMEEQADYVLYMGKQIYKNKDYRTAMPILQQAAQLKPTTGILCDLGDCYYKLGKYDEAEACWLMARDMIPGRITARYHLFCLYQEIGQWQKAYYIAHEIIQMKVKVVNSLTLDMQREAKKYLDCCEACEY